MNEKEIKILNEIIDNMENILDEKREQYQDKWKTCDIEILKLKLLRECNKLFLIQYSNNILRRIIHIFNYAFFLYFRITQIKE